MAKEYEEGEDGQSVKKSKTRRSALQIRELFGMIQEVARVKKMTRDDGKILMPKLQFVKHLINTVYGMTPDMAFQQWKDTKNTGYTEIKDGVRVCAVTKNTELNKSDGIEVKKKKRVKNAGEMKEALGNLAQDLKGFGMGSSSSNALCDMLGAGSSRGGNDEGRERKPPVDDSSDSSGPSIEEVQSSESEVPARRRKKHRRPKSDDDDEAEEDEKRNARIGVR